MLTVHGKHFEIQSNNTKKRVLSPIYESQMSKSAQCTNLGKFASKTYMQIAMCDFYLNQMQPKLINRPNALNGLLLSLCK